MDSHPKVMTVSYGTFSCTLDGFDDPFTTMQLVAEYFRKLSADDRYFGGEPLQPDASKLHQIAESANPNRIDAEVTENSVILRQADIVDVPAKEVDDHKEAVALVDQDDVTPEVDIEKIPDTTAELEESSNVSVEDNIPAAFSSRRKVEPAVEANDDLYADTIDDIVISDTVDEAPVEVAEAEPTPEPIAAETFDKLTTALEDNINDTTTADELAPSLVEEIPSETVSAAVKALKSGEAVDRWLETANEKMSAPEHVSKANALERLKAAVAATEAERSVRMENITSEVVETGEERRDNTISFRRELAKVRKAYEHETSVFSRPKARSAASGRANGVARPLVLDVDQRIDRTGGSNVGITPASELKKKSGLTLVSNKGKPKPEPETTPLTRAERRAAKREEVARAKQAEVTSAKPVEPQKPAAPVEKTELPNFDEFSKIMGASTLIELLEASAAYMSVVQGVERYTEKQISANLPAHIKRIVKEDERIGTLDQLTKRGFVEAGNDGSFTISMARKAAYQKKYLAG